VLDLFRENGEVANPIGPAWIEEAGRDITALGSFAVLTILVIATIIYLVLRQRTRTALFVAFAVMGGTAISSGLKAIFDRPRPELLEATRVFTASFPSGHATISAVVYLTLGVMLAEATTHRRLRVYFLGLAIFLTVIIGISRLYLGVHYPTDVIAGWSIGTAWALLCWVASKALQLRRDPEL
jgi:undecaprenyl-diphosphatase